MKTILVDAVYTFVSDSGEIFEDLYKLLEEYLNPKIIVTNASMEKFPGYGLNSVPYDVFTLSHNPEKTDPKYFEILLDKYKLTKDEVIYFEHNPEAVKSAQSVGINTYYYDSDKKDLTALKKFLDENVV